MPRHARVPSGSEVYHVMLRGINKQTIFADGKDSFRFLDTVERYKAECGYKVLAYCLMGNHVHLLMKCEYAKLADAFKKICGSYAYYYNHKYDRTGHLFQDRFRSEAVEDDAYLLTALRYIHRNPVKAGMVSEPQEYPFSSYREYINHPKAFSYADTEFILEIISREELIRYTNTSEDDTVLGEDSALPKPKSLDGKLLSIMQDSYSCGSAAEVRALPRKRKTEMCLEMLREGGGIRQISRLTGIDPSSISRMK